MSLSCMESEAGEKSLYITTFVKSSLFVFCPIFSNVLPPSLTVISRCLTPTKMFKKQKGLTEKHDIVLINLLVISNPLQVLRYSHILTFRSDEFSESQFVCLLSWIANLSYRMHTSYHIRGPLLEQHQVVGHACPLESRLSMILAQAEKRRLLSLSWLALMIYHLQLCY